MPRKVPAWACEFKCRRGLLTKRKAMELHEQVCAENPARRTCKTCEHDVHHTEEGDTGYPGGWACDVDVDKAGKQLRYDCERWNPR